MSALVAIDVALLLPSDVAATAARLSAALPEKEWQGLRLDDEHLPHITLTQQFVRAVDLDAALSHVDAVVRDVAPLALRVTGGGHGSSSVWMTIEPTRALRALHRKLMEALRGFERDNAGLDAFFEGDARERDRDWVARYRTQSSFAAFNPHVTLGHARHPPSVAPFAFAARTVAACHLGRFCACRRMLRTWTLE